MSRRPSRIELLELDIDLRLADLWAEATEVDEWSIEVVAALMRAAYGKGYCDALIEDEPGESLPRSRVRRARPQTVPRDVDERSAGPAGAARATIGSWLTGAFRCG